MPTGTDHDHDALRRTVLAAALAHVPFDGWTQVSLNAGARDAELPEGSALLAFPNGPIEAIAFWAAETDRAMLEALAAIDPAKLRVRERIATAVRLRLEAVAVHREALRRALGLLALPHNAPRAAELTWRTVDAIWWAAGDTATDFNFYSKRVLLVGVYGATLLRFLDDRSEGASETWAFLDRRIADVMRVPQALGSLREAIAKLPNPFDLLRAGPFRRR
ncbi:MAG: COQ9 family protein [Alphaproteobacteria bacterium]|nr:COQ9 family protein [Alphaproteobacteria bacterium]